MTLPDGFQFSQGSLQNFSECRRRFELLYLKRVAWPAVEAEPAVENERYKLDGERFHRLVYQHQLGIPADLLTRQAQGGNLERWWRHYLEMLEEAGGVLHYASQGARRYAEVGLSAPLGGYRLVGQYDLVIVTPGGAARILDWKTARNRPRRTWLASRLQTRIYPYLLARAGAALNDGQPISPEAIEMVYWFADFPDQPERFPYSAAAFEKDQADLSEMIATIQRLEEGQFPMTAEEKRCRYCTYRSLCERGVQAGPLEGGDLKEAEILSTDWGFEQIAEIEY